MSWHNYIVLKEEKLLVDIGNVSGEIYESDLEIFCKFFDEEVFDSDYELIEKKYNNISMKGMQKLISSYESSLNVKSMKCYLHSLAIGRLLKADGKQIKIIGGNERKKFKGYKIL